VTATHAAVRFTRIISGGEEWYQTVRVRPELIKRVYDMTNSVSPVRRILVEGFSILVRDSTTLDKDLPSQLLIDIVRGLRTQVKNLEQRYEGLTKAMMLLACIFHEHITEAEKSRCLRYQGDIRN
jgi:hypothetical protein